MLSLYLTRRTWLHALPAWSKLLALSLAGTALVMVSSLSSMGLIGALVTLLYCSLGRAAWRQWRMLRGLLVAALLIIGFHWWIGDPAIGLLTALRLMAATMLALMLTLTTRFDDLLQVLETLLSPLRRLGVPTERIALGIGLMLRFAENFTVQWQRLDDAHRARGGRSSSWRLLAPLAVRALQSAERVADALAARLGH
ncbi:biotin transport system permease protein [Herbaspirillum sp. Sphag1AN]|uniref:energy-coupling factor transporter transmembrane component T family protein n=1 Tax=unclassified Herbaspirillum TaxID=2624150 RepID=UPI00160F787A|nr:MULTISPECIES: energy-coupling factor transporter transmembrane protein EcfT [unclassified Herbaspirillum]MBB3211717.1 biotin transport system permease protein [Herbaspirillum sp. Sphag1AN]MBB3245015.1 biotin transport system permease protein [Herbaspirillum sp. Sphag64]